MEQPTAFSPVCADGAQPRRPGRKSFSTARPAGPSRMWLRWLRAHLPQHWGSSPASLPFAAEPCLGGPCPPPFPASLHLNSCRLLLQRPCLCGLALPPPCACPSSLTCFTICPSYGPPGPSQNTPGSFPPTSLAPAVSCAWDSFPGVTNHPN